MNPSSNILELPPIMQAAVQGPDGTIYTMPAPARHNDIHRLMMYEHDIEFPEADDMIHGFLCSDGTFVNRRRALDHAYLHKQVLPKYRDKTHGELNTDHLWGASK